MIVIKALCFGSLNIDYTYKVNHFVQKGETLSSDELHVFSGGKGLNQSIALARAGVDTYHAGAVGEDGRFLIEELDASGVNTSLVKVMHDVRTGNAIIQNNKEGDNCIILYAGANHAITKKQVDEALRQFECGDFILIQNEINEVDYIMEQAHTKGMKIVLNPSPMNEKIKSLPLDYVDFFILNEVEASQILELDLENGFDAMSMAKALHNNFAKASIVLTLGSDGAIYIDNENEIWQPACKVNVVDTTAAGDTFTGFFISGIVNGLSVIKSMELATKASSIAVTRAGASPSIPKLEEIS